MHTPRKLAPSRGDPNLAAKFFHEICDLYPETMERLAWLYYLSATRRRQSHPPLYG
jgi:hypothetical protein